MNHMPQKSCVYGALHSLGFSIFSGCRKSPPARSSAVISVLRAAASRRLHSETRLRAQADGGIKFNPVISEDMRLGNDTSHEILTDNFRVPRKPFMVFWERRSSGGNEHSGLPGCERSAACNDDIEVKISCSPIRKSGFCHFFDGLSIFYLQFKNNKEKCVMIPDARRRRWE